MIWGPPKAYQRALALRQEIRRHEHSLLQQDPAAADGKLVADALQQRVHQCWEEIEADKDLLAASYALDRWLAVEDDPDSALGGMSEADIKRRLASSR
ncbi:MULTISPECIES: hypothetical protein [Cupriavidus]